MTNKELLDTKIQNVKKAHKELRDVIRKMTDEELAEFKDKLQEIKEDLEDTLDNIKEFREGFTAKYGVNLWRFLITLGVIAILAIIF